MDYDEAIHVRPRGGMLKGAVAGLVFAAAALVGVPSLLPSAQAQVPFSDCLVDIVDGFATVFCTESEPRTAAARERDGNGQTSTTADKFEVNEHILILDEGVGDVYLEVNRPFAEDEAFTVTFYAGTTPLSGENLSDGNGFKTELQRTTYNSDGSVRGSLPLSSRTMGARLFGQVSERGGKYYLHFTIRDDNLSAPDMERPTKMEWTIVSDRSHLDTSGTVQVRWDDDDGRRITCADVSKIHNEAGNYGSTLAPTSTYKLPDTYMLTVNYDHNGTRTTSVNSVEVIGQPLMSTDFTAQGAC